jgi:hypothetical protein
MTAHSTVPAPFTPSLDPPTGPALAPPAPALNPRSAVLAAEFAPGANCRPFEAHALLLQLCPASDGVRARWSGRRWVQGPDGREVLVRVVLLEMLSGTFHVGVTRLESGVSPVIVRLDVADPNRPTFTVASCDLFGTGESVRLTVEPAE